MSVFRRLGKIQDNGARHGTFRTTNHAADQTPEEREKQTEILNSILDELNMGQADVSELNVIPGEMQFVLSPNTRIATVVSAHGGRVIEEIPNLGTSVVVPLHFSHARKAGIIKNGAFMGALGLMVVCGVWVGYTWLSHDNIWSEITFGYLTATGVRT